MSNARFSILQARAISDEKVSDAQFRTLAALGMYADKNGWCFPSLKILGKDLHKSPQAVGRDTIALRKLGYLQVKNRYDTKTKARHSNLYRLLFDFNVDDSTLSTPEVDTLSTPEVEVNVPINDTINKSLSEKTKQTIPDNMSLDWYVSHGLPVPATLNDSINREKAAIDAFEQALNIPANWNWYPAKTTDEKVWRDFRVYLVGLYEADSQCFVKYAQWRRKPFAKGAVAIATIKRDPSIFASSWADFLASDAMYGQIEDDRPEFKKFRPEEGNYVPRPKS